MTNIFNINDFIEDRFNTSVEIKLNKFDDGWVDSGRMISFENALKNLI